MQQFVPDVSQSAILELKLASLSLQRRWKSGNPFSSVLVCLGLSLASLLPLIDLPPAQVAPPVLAGESGASLPALNPEKP